MELSTNTNYLEGKKLSKSRVNSVGDWILDQFVLQLLATNLNDDRTMSPEKNSVDYPGCKTEPPTSDD